MELLQTVAAAAVLQKTELIENCFELAVGLVVELLLETVEEQQLGIVVALEPAVAQVLLQLPVVEFSASWFVVED